MICVPYNDNVPLDIRKLSPQVHLIIHLWTNQSIEGHIVDWHDAQEDVVVAITSQCVNYWREGTEATDSCDNIFSQKTAYAPVHVHCHG